MVPGATSVIECRLSKLFRKQWQWGMAQLFPVFLENSATTKAKIQESDISSLSHE